VRTWAAATGVAGLCLTHIGPAASWLPAVRDRMAPGLAGRGRPDHVALTFDDGPDPVSTPRFLDALDDLGVRATFFVLGSRVAYAPGLAADAVARGHEIAVHGWSHRPQWLPTPGRDALDLRRSVTLIEDVCGARPLWYRPPFGVLTSGLWQAAHSLELRPVLWGAWGRDWIEDRSPDDICRTVAPRLRGGETLLLHDTSPDGSGQAWRSTLAALPRIVERCRGEGWEIGTLAEHW
jgi:peptidoglycan/xylan/chitin deacetylase (PgdA/CDA1 family)